MKVNLERIGEVTLNIGSPGFGQSVYRLFADALAIRFCAVFAFPPDSEPRVIVSEGESPGDCEAVRKFAVEYSKQSREHIADTASHNLTLTSNPGNPGDHLRLTAEPAIEYQLVQFGALDGVSYCVSLCRDERAGSFCANDVTAMRRLGRFAFSAVHRHFDLDRQSAASRQELVQYAPKQVAPLDTPAMRTHMREVFLEAPHRLTRREAEVCAGIVLGYSTTAIGLNLRIAFNTVATHRKRAYKKLGVSTQNELFARYFDTISRMYATARRP